MNRAEIEQLAAAANRLRPDWRYDALVTFLTRNATDRPLWAAARALVWIALEPGRETGTFAHQTPRLFTDDGPWWSQQVIVAAGSTPTPVPVGWCSLHQREDSTTNPCRACIDRRQAALHDPARIAEIRASFATEPTTKEPSNA